MSKRSTSLLPTPVRASRPKQQFQIQEILSFEGKQWRIVASEWGGDNRFISVQEWVYSLVCVDEFNVERFLTEPKLLDLAR